MRRCVMLKFPFIPPSKRLTELEIGKGIRALGPQVLRAIFSIVSKAMTLVPKYAGMANKPLMADFAVWSCAITEALGRDPNGFLHLYRDNQKLQTEEVISSDLFSTHLVEYLEMREALEKKRTFVSVKQTLLDSLTMGA